MPNDDTVTNTEQLEKEQAPSRSHSSIQAESTHPTTNTPEATWTNSRLLTAL